MVTFPEGVLMTRGGPDEGSLVSLPMGPTVIGRLGFNDLVLDEPGVSRQHATIRGDSEGYWIQDLDSHNGTFVNGDRLGNELRRLLNGDKVMIGGMEAEVHWVFELSDTTKDMPKTS